MHLHDRVLLQRLFIEALDLYVTAKINGNEDHEKRAKKVMSDTLDRLLGR